MIKDKNYYDEKHAINIKKKLTIYDDIYKKVNELIKEPTNFLDIGCGTGDVIKFIDKNKIQNYTGIDFSSVGIENCKKNYPNYNFFEFDFSTSKIDSFMAGRKTFLSLEVLEHIENDINIIKQIPLGIRLILSLPNFNSPGHVRFFKDENEIKERYKDYLNFKNSFVFNIKKVKIFLFDTVRI